MTRALRRAVSLQAWQDAAYSCIGLVLAALLAACATSSTLPPGAGTGPTPTLPPPEQFLAPTIHIAPAHPWSPNDGPRAAAGTAVHAFARGLDHPRWLYVLPNGDVLVAETNAPERPEDGRGFAGVVMRSVMKRAGAGTTSPNRITLLRDTDGDGVADLRTTFIAGLDSPFGMALVDDALYVATNDAVLRFRYVRGATRVASEPAMVAELPAGRINHHWTKNLIASPDGTRLYVTVGSNSNIAENGMAAESGRAEIREIDLAAGSQRAFATGLRNANGLAWEPRTGTLWTVVNERDELGNDLVPDFLAAVVDGAFYGWPYSYWGAHPDPRVHPQRPDLVATARVPDYALGSHVAALGLCAAAGNRLPARFADGMFIGEHGSWNRTPYSGYAVVFVPFAGGRPAGPPVEVLGGFVDADGDARGRPVGVALDARGALLVADDVGGVIWRVTTAPDVHRAGAASP
jgi:glucose/arabinose dehydrogenase